ncbi:MAG: YceI family protein [Steroidobacteraceae bacterium]|nr:YceI family protein [Steroidobacteraceae bacterium]
MKKQSMKSKSRIFAAVAAALFAAAAPAGAAVLHYALDAAHSRLEFTGTQAGAPFTALFQHFTATIAFAPTDLADSRFDVVIEVASADSKDKDRDGAMRGTDIFDVARFPTAEYVTRAFAKTGAGFTATGTLSLRGVARTVPIAFTFTPTPGGAILRGTAKLERLDFGVGQGQWKNTTWIGNDVGIAFSLSLKPMP